MGSSGSKKLPKEDMDFLMENTNFTKQQIKAWYSGFMVGTQLQQLHLDWPTRSAPSAGELGLMFCCCFSFFKLFLVTSFTPIISTSISERSSRNL